MSEWLTDRQGNITNGPGTMKEGDRIRIVNWPAEGEEVVVEITEIPEPEAGGSVTLNVRQVSP